MARYVPFSVYVQCVPWWWWRTWAACTSPTPSTTVGTIPFINTPALYLTKTWKFTHVSVLSSPRWGGEDFDNPILPSPHLPCPLSSLYCRHGAWHGGAGCSGCVPHIVPESGQESPRGLPLSSPAHHRRHHDWQHAKLQGTLFSGHEKGDGQRRQWYTYEGFVSDMPDSWRVLCIFFLYVVSLCGPQVTAPGRVLCGDSVGLEEWGTDMDYLCPEVRSTIISTCWRACLCGTGSQRRDKALCAIWEGRSQTG